MIDLRSLRRTWPLWRKAPHWYDKDEIAEYAANWEKHKSANLIESVKPKTMLHQETLSLLDLFAGNSRHGILEIGPYTGFSTVVIAQALRKKLPLITIELGGSYDHPELPSTDIVADLRKNLADEGVANRVNVIEGHSSGRGVKDQVKKYLLGRKIDFLVIDADGHVGRDIELYGDLLVDGAVIACDDYAIYGESNDGGAALKEGLVKPWIDKAVQSGLLRDLGVYRWGTWFGQYVKPPTSD